MEGSKRRALANLMPSGMTVASASSAAGGEDLDSADCRSATSSGPTAEHPPGDADSTDSVVDAPALGDQGGEGVGGLGSGKAVGETSKSSPSVSKLTRRPELPTSSIKLEAMGVSAAARCGAEGWGR